MDQGSTIVFATAVGDGLVTRPFPSFAAQFLHSFFYVPDFKSHRANPFALCSRNLAIAVSGRLGDTRLVPMLI